jgi:hypothetical protein
VLSRMSGLPPTIRSRMKNPDASRRAAMAGSGTAASCSEVRLPINLDFNPYCLAQRTRLSWLTRSTVNPALCSNDALSVAIP